MQRFGVLRLVIALPVLLIAAVVTGQNLASILADDERDADRSAPLVATVVATGIPGAGAIAQAGTFHAGGPFAPGGALAAASCEILLCGALRDPLERPSARGLTPKQPADRRRRRS